MGFSGNLGDPVISTSKKPEGTKPVEQVPGLWMGHTGVHRNETPEMREVVLIGGGIGSHWEGDGKS